MSQYKQGCADGTELLYGYDGPLETYFITVIGPTEGEEEEVIYQAGQMD